MINLSLTLRDAQHLCWKTFKKLETKNEKPSSTTELISGLVKQIGELADKIRSLENSGNAASKDEVRRLLSELFYAEFVLAERYGVNLEESFMQTIDEYILGFVS